ncbi:MAG: DUF6186 family protein [Acidimicrobiales bacterium]|nr:DUF6186 family protein [Acidimicrobiales bacterium]
MMRGLPPADRTTNLVIWVVLWTLFFGWTAFTALRHDLPRFATLVSAFRQRRWARWALLAAWAWLGWHLFVRTWVGAHGEP